MNADDGDKLAIMGLLLWGLFSMGLWAVRTLSAVMRRTVRGRPEQ